MDFPCPRALDPALVPLIQKRLDDLTKPQGSLGRLERLALQLARIAGEVTPPDPAAYLLTFAGDHGVARHGVSAYPAEVTAQMVANIASGTAASSVLCRAHRIHHRVVDVGVAAQCRHPAVSQRNVMRGTEDSLTRPAMTREQAHASIQAGVQEVAELGGDPFSLLCVGEMGIGNSAVAAMIACALTAITPEEAVGPGTGVTGQQLQHKIQVVRAVLEQRRPDRSDPVGALAAVGGTEFGAMTGAMLAGAARGWAVVVDGYIAGTAALVALAMQPRLRDFLIWSHRSAEPGASKIIEHVGVEPVLDLELRLGEGTGAALVVPILRAALSILREMATFSGAGVSGRT
jgi:nicotinate-nucleotide--dimethylbenzimidazole phosphoribosyltransferase